MLSMKTIFQQTLLAVFLITLFASVGFAAEQIELQNQDQNIKKIGYHTNINLGVFYVIPKFGLDMGYQLNQHISIDAKLSTLVGIIWTAEVASKINFTNAKWSPYISGSLGYMASIIPSDDVEESNAAIAFLNIGVGTDLKLSEKTRLFGAVHVWTPVNKREEETFLAPEVGIQWSF